MRRAVIVSTARTPIGKAYRGAFNDTQPQALAGHAIAQAVRRASYARRVRLSEYLRPIDTTAPADAWPHTLWTAPHAVPTSLDQ